MKTQKEENNSFKRIPLDASFEGLNRLIVLVFNDINNELKERVIENISYQE